ncbi:MAG TPA: condensation domain-containing protein, partial [Vicinamibacterales bacterium]|nr:condensation domain-containing protein [Vicinamibacterales bacterium]
MDTPGEAAPTHTITSAWRIVGPVNHAALEEAWRDVVARHETLRTRFPLRRGVAVQEVLPVSPELSALDRERVDPRSVAERLGETTRCQLDVRDSPPVRAQLWTLLETEHLFVLLLHEIVADAASRRVLLRDLQSAYASRCASRSPAWTSLRLRYADYRRQHDRDMVNEEQGADAQRQLAFWREVLQKAGPPLRLPADQIGEAVSSCVRGRVPLTVPADLHGRLARIAKEYDAQLSDVLHAGIAVLLNRLGAGTEIPIGIPVAGRTGVALETLVGAFANTLLLGVDTSGDPSLGAVITRARQAAGDAVAHREVRVEQLAEALGIREAGAGQSLFQVMVSLDDTAGEQFTLSGLEIVSEPMPVRPAAEELHFRFRELRSSAGDPSGLTGAIEYRMGLFSARVAEQLAGGLVSVLEATASDPSCRVETVDVSIATRSAVGQSRREPTKEDGTRAPLLEWFRERGIQIDAETAHDLLVELTRFRGDAADRRREQVRGPWPATPIMRWLEEREGPLERLHQAVMVDVPVNATETAILTALQAVVDHHEALRLRVTPNSRPWQLTVLPPGGVRAAECLQRVDIRKLARADAERRLANAAASAVGRFEPHNGRLVQAVWADAGPESEGSLLVIAHHLAVDGVSWRILVPDLLAACAAATTGRIPTLPPATTSFCRWAELLAAAAPGRARELTFWEAQLRERAGLIPASRSDAAHTTRAHEGRLLVTIGEAVTRAVLTTIPSAFYGHVNDALLTALALAVARWREVQGASAAAVTVDIEGHGREETLAADVDLTRTVGWFTSLYPVRLELAGVDLADAFAGGAAAGRALKQVKEQLRAVPGRGLGYGLLRYLHPPTASRLAQLPSPQVGFNYLGRTDAGSSHVRFELPDVVATQMRAASAGVPQPHVLDVNVLALDGAHGPELRAVWTWGALTDSDIRMIADAWSEALGALALHAGRPGAGGHTPSDLSLVAIGQDEIEHLESTYGGLQDVWPLAPLQKGLLFHGVYDATASDVYTAQALVALDGSIEPARLRAAASALQRRHPNLGAVFSYDSEPVQVIPRDVPLAWDEYELSDEDTEPALAAWLRADRRKRFDLARPPLLRWTLIRVGADPYRLVLTFHHALLDGWSMPVLLRDLEALYVAHGAMSKLPPATPYQDYLQWARAQDSAAARAAWSTALAELEQGTHVAAPGQRAAEPAQFDHVMSEVLTSRVRQQARVLGVTVNTMLQAAWALVLAQLTGRYDVVFGTTVSGRPSELPHVDTLVGLLINTVPVRVRLDMNEQVRALLLRIQDEQAALLPAQHLPLNEVQQVAGVGSLFDTLLVFENYPLTRPRASAGEVRLEIAGAYDATHYPLVLLFMPGSTLQLRCEYRADVLTLRETEAIVARIARALDFLTGDPAQRVGAVALLPAAERTAVLEAWQGPWPGDAGLTTIPALVAAQVAARP